MSDRAAPLEPTSLGSISESGAERMRSWRDAIAEWTGVNPEFGQTLSEGEPWTLRVWPVYPEPEGLGISVAWPRVAPY